MKNNNELALKLLETFKRFKKTNFQEGAKCFLTPAQIGILHMICYNCSEPDKGITVTQLSEASQQTASAVTQTLNALEKENLIKRNIDTKDRRVIRVTLTPKGKTTVQDHHRKLLELSQGFIEHLGPEKIKIFIDILEEIIEYKEKGGK